jgi:hypothetical protein
MGSGSLCPPLNLLADTQLLYLTHGVLLPLESGPRARGTRTPLLLSTPIRPEGIRKQGAVLMASLSSLTHRFGDDECSLGGVGYGPLLPFAS